MFSSKMYIWTILKHLVHVIGNTYREYGAADTRREFVFRFDFLKIIFGPIFRNCCLPRLGVFALLTRDQMAHPPLPPVNETWIFGIPGASRLSLLVVVAVVVVESIRTAWRNVQNVETAVLRERFPKCAYGLIYGIFSEILPNQDLLHERERWDYGDAIFYKSHSIRCNLTFCLPVDSM